jgi:hypothetical protein
MLSVCPTCELLKGVPNPPAKQVFVPRACIIVPSYTSEDDDTEDGATPFEQPSSSFANPPNHPPEKNSDEAESMKSGKALSLASQGTLTSSAGMIANHSSSISFVY